VAYVVTGLVVLGVIGFTSAMQLGNDETSHQDLLSSGEHYLHELDYEQALAFFLQVMKLNPTHPMGYDGAARALVGLGRHSDAIDTLRDGIEMTGDDVLTLLIREIIQTVREQEDAERDQEQSEAEPEPEEPEIEHGATFETAPAPPGSGGPGGFSVTPNLPENQNPDTSGFFDLWVTPGMLQEIAIDVTNFGNEPIIVEISLLTAGTNINGIIDYSPSSASQHDSSIPFRFEDIASLPTGASGLTIPAQTVATIPIAVDIPSGGFEGITLGAIHVLLGITEQERAQAGMIINRFASVVPVRMQVYGTPPAEPDFYLGEITAETVNFREAIVSNIHHLAPRLTMGALTNVRIYPAGGDTAIFALESMSTDFAPNTIFHATIMDTPGTGIQPGDYIARVTIEYGGKAWEFQRAFTV